MSHRFKARKPGVSYTHPRENRQAAELRRLARGIINQQHLESIMLQVKPELRSACFQKISALLPFTPQPIGHILRAGE